MNKNTTNGWGCILPPTTEFIGINDFYLVKNSL